MHRPAASEEACNGLRRQREGGPGPPEAATRLATSSLLWVSVSSSERW